MKQNSLFARLKSQKGQGTVEYALITIAVVIIIGTVLIATGGAGPLGTAITDAFDAVSAEVTEQTA